VRRGLLLLGEVVLRPSRRGFSLLRGDDALLEVSLALGE
jgi:hypothetical protein